MPQRGPKEDLTERLEHLHATKLPLEEHGVVQGVEGSDHTEQENLEATWHRQRDSRRGRGGQGVPSSHNQMEEREKPPVQVWSPDCSFPRAQWLERSNVGLGFIPIGPIWVWDWDLFQQIPFGFGSEFWVNSNRSRLGLVFGFIPIDPI